METVLDGVTTALAEQCGGKTINSALSSDSKFIYPFNCAAIDIPFGGGVHSGKIYEIFGEESGGKTTLTLEFTKAFSNYCDSRGDNNYAVLWIESESALDRQRAIHIGCRLDKFIFEEAETVEDARDFMFRYLERCIEKNLKLLIVWDTLASAATNNELKASVSQDEKEKFAGGMMEKPRIISSMLRNVTNLLGKTCSTLILVNQVRMKPGQYVTTLEPPGGKSIRFHCSVRTLIKKTGEVYAVLPNNSKRMVAIESELFHVKNKLTSPKQASSIYIDTEAGVNKLETTIRFLKSVENSPIKIRGGGYCTFSMPDRIATIDGDEILKGKDVEITFRKSDKLLSMLETYPHVIEWLDYLVYTNYFNSTILVKVMVIEKLWEYERKFFGKEITQLTEYEMKLYLTRKHEILIPLPVFKSEDIEDEDIEEVEEIEDEPIDELPPDKPIKKKRSKKLNK